VDPSWAFTKDGIANVTNIKATNKKRKFFFLIIFSSIKKSVVIVPDMRNPVIFGAEELPKKNEQVLDVKIKCHIS